MKKMNKKNPLVFLDVSIDGDPAAKMVFELFSDAAPKTAENFRALCTGDKGNSPITGRPLHYKGSYFHLIIKGLLTQGGGFERCDGSLGESIYGEEFPEEPISKLKHDERGLLTMAIADRDVRGSLFSITFKPRFQLDSGHLVFGKLVQGYKVLEEIENVEEVHGRPMVAIKIINCGEFFDGNAVKKLKAKRKKSSRKNRKRRRKHYSSGSETSVDSETESSDSDSESSYLSSSSDDKRKKRKKSSKRDRYKRKKKSKRHERKHRKRVRKSKRRSKRASDSLTDTDSQSEGPEGGEADVNGINENHKPQAEMIAQNQTHLTVGAASVEPEKSLKTDICEKEVEYLWENGGRQSYETGLESKAGTTVDRPDIFDDHPGKSRSRSLSPRRSLSKSMSISPEKNLSPRQSPSFDKHPQVSYRKSMSRSPIRSPMRDVKRSISRSTVKFSRGSGRSPSRRSRTPVKTSRRSISRSPVRARARRSFSRSPVPNRRRSISRSPVRARARRSFSRSPVPNRRRSLSKSPKDGSPKRIRRGRGFSQHYSYARRYRTPSPDHSPVRSYRYGRNDRERYRRSPMYNRSPVRDRISPRKSPRRFRSPPPERSPHRKSPQRLRSPLRYKSRKSRTRSPVSRSSSPYRAERSVSPYRAERSRSPLITKSSSSLRETNGRERSMSSSPYKSPPGVVNKKRLVSYDEHSPDFDETKAPVW